MHNYKSNMFNSSAVCCVHTLPYGVPALVAGGCPECGELGCLGHHAWRGRGGGDVLLSVVGSVAPQFRVQPSQVQQATRIHGPVWWATPFCCRLGALPPVGGASQVDVGGTWTLLPMLCISEPSPTAERAVAGADCGAPCPLVSECLRFQRPAGSMHSFLFCSQC